MTHNIMPVSSQWPSERCYQVIIFLCVQLALSCYLFHLTSIIRYFPSINPMPSLCSGTRAVCWAEKTRPTLGSKSSTETYEIWFQSCCLIYVNWKIMFGSCMLGYWGKHSQCLLVRATGNVWAFMKCNEAFYLHSILLHIWQLDPVCWWTSILLTRIFLRTSWPWFTWYLSVICSCKF